MKFLVIAFALVASACADVSELGYKYQHPAPSVPAPVVIARAPVPLNSYIPPAAPQPAPVESVPEPAIVVPAPVNTYIPPPQAAPEPSIPASISASASASVISESASVISESTPINSYIPPPQAAPEPSIPAPAISAPAPLSSYIPPPVVHQPELEEIEQPAVDGYRYKTVRRVVYRHRA